MMSKLNEILNTGEACLEMLNDNKYDDVEEQINGYTRALNEYLRSVDITALDTEQQDMLGRINEIHRTVMEMINEYKQNIRLQIEQLRKGKNMENFYNNR